MDKLIEKKLKIHAQKMIPNIEYCQSKEEFLYDLELIKAQTKFANKIRNMSKQQALDILDKIKEQDDLINLLEQSELDPSFKSDEYMQQQFFEETNWFYPDDDYI